jgi:HK97 family phage major capsid protein
MVEQKQPEKQTEVQPETGLPAEPQELPGEQVEVDDGQGEKLAWFESNLAEKEQEVAELKQVTSSLQADVEGLNLNLQRAVEGYRGMVLKAYPDVPEELITGQSIEQVDAALEQAKKIMTRVKKSLQSSASFKMPAGCSTRLVNGPDKPEPAGENQICHRRWLLMALTLAEASKLSNDILVQGVVEMVVKDSPVLQRLPFIEITGNGLTYNIENTLPEISFYSVGEDWGESTPTFDQHTAALKILGGDADVDSFLKATRSNIQDLEAAVIELKAKALKHKFEEAFVYGDSSVDGKQFDGLRKLLGSPAAADQVISMGDSGATLTLDKLDELVDAIKGGKPDMLLMSRRSRRKINSLVRASGGMIETDRDSWGNFIHLWNGIPIGVNDWIKDTHILADGEETATSGGDCSTIYAVQFGEDALCGLSSPGFIGVESVGALETKDATRTRVKWYCAIALFSSLKAAALIGVQD